MNGQELAAFLGLGDLDPEAIAKIVGALPRATRATYEKMKRVYDDLLLWEAGVGPMPADTIVCKPHRRRRV